MKSIRTFQIRAKQDINEQIPVEAVCHIDKNKDGC